MSFTHIDIGEDEWILQCNDCGAYVRYMVGEAEADVLKRLEHHPDCVPGDAEKWEAFYAEADEEEDDGDADWQSWL